MYFNLLNQPSRLLFRRRDGHFFAQLGVYARQRACQFATVVLSRATLSINIIHQYDDYYAFYFIKDAFYSAYIGSNESP